MKAERIKELRDCWYFSREIHECLDAIEALQAEVWRLQHYELERDPVAHATIAELRERERRECDRVLALQATAREVAKELRDIHMIEQRTGATRARELAEKLEAALGAEAKCTILEGDLTTMDPNCPCKKCSESRVYLHNKHFGAEARAETTAANKPEACTMEHTSGATCYKPLGHDLPHFGTTQTGNGIFGYEWYGQPVAAPAAERCTARLTGAAFNVQCELPSGHAEMHHESETLANNSWTDKARGATPHKKKHEPACTCTGSAAEASQCRIHVYHERVEQEPNQAKTYADAVREDAELLAAAWDERDATRVVNAHLREQVAKLTAELEEANRVIAELEANEGAAEAEWVIRAENAEAELAGFKVLGKTVAWQEPDGLKRWEDLVKERDDLGKQLAAIRAVLK